MTPHRTRRCRQVVTALVGLSVAAYAISLLMPYGEQPQIRGYSFFTMVYEVPINQGLAVGWKILTVFWANPCWFLSLLCWARGYKLGHAFLSLINLAILGFCACLLILHSASGYVPLGDCAMFWGIAISTMAVAGLLNLVGRVEPVAEDDDS